MQAFKKKLQQLVYSFSTEDRYADYDEEAANQDVAAGVERSITESNHGSQIQLADYVDGSNPSGNEGISEALLAWRHIDNWTSQHNPDLAATLSDPCTRHDINNAEKDLDIIFPASVRASLRLHDGQEDLESMTGTGGLFFGLQLMGLDEIVQMTRTWRNVAENLERKNHELQIKMDKHQELNGTTVDLPNQQKGYGKLENQDYKAMDPNLQRNISQNYKKQFKLPDIPDQHSVPPLAIQQVYANSGWIPLVTDNAGNHIGIDLAPGPKGKYGQVILFGREFDTKFVVASNWGDFLLSFANDLELGNWLLIDEGNDQFAGEGELVFRDKKSNGPVRDYLEVLVMRSRMKWNSFTERKLPEEPKRTVSSSQGSQNTVEPAEQQETALTVDETLDEKNEASLPVDNTNTKQEVKDPETTGTKTGSSAKSEDNLPKTSNPDEVTADRADKQVTSKHEQNESTNAVESTETSQEGAVETSEKPEENPKKQSKKTSKKKGKKDEKKNSDSKTKEPVVEEETDSHLSNSVEKLKDDFENVAL
ncbi:Smi1 [Kluyveromyces lactis]|nr:Smi1 [Kluyveromyces lactis]